MKDKLKRLAFDIEYEVNKKFSNDISSSFLRKEVRNLVSQFVVDEIFPHLPLTKQKMLLKEMGFTSMAECAKKLGFSRQWVHKNKNLLQEKIYYNGKYLFKT